MEVCVESVVSAVNAEKGGASRIELCGNLIDGGTTPSLGLVRRVQCCVTIPVMIMIRPRGGDFCYSEEEFETMKEDIEIFKKESVDGFVLGILNIDGSIDKDRCALLLNLCSPHPVTFHRAFDMAANPFSTLETIISLGFSRVLTSGQGHIAFQGLDLITKLVNQAAGRIIVMPGGGISIDNLETILQVSGTTEFHGSASVIKDSDMQYRNESISMGLSPDYSLKVTDVNRVIALINIANRIWKIN